MLIKAKHEKKKVVIWKRTEFFSFSSFFHFLSLFPYKCNLTKP